MVALQRWVEGQDQSDMSDQSPLTMLPVSPMSREKHVIASNPIYGGELPNTPPRGGEGTFKPSVIYQNRPPPKSPSVSPRSDPRPPLTRSVSPERYVPQFLLVEDNAINMKILCAYMKKLGRSYATAEDGQVAVDKFREKPGYFDCLLMDISKHCVPECLTSFLTRQLRLYALPGALKTR